MSALATRCSRRQIELGHWSRGSGAPSSCCSTQDGERRISSYPGSPRIRSAAELTMVTRSYSSTTRMPCSTEASTVRYFCRLADSACSLRRRWSRASAKSSRLLATRPSRASSVTSSSVK